MHAHVAHQSSPLTSITEQAQLHVLSLYKLGKSYGSDGVPYELLQCIVQADLKCEFIEMLNSILDGSYPVPENWLTNRVACLAKVATPCMPSHFRPIVLSTTACKIFTKILLLRLRPKFPETMFGQLYGIQNSQTPDGSLAAQQLAHFSQVELSKGPTTSRQSLHKGLVQGSAYSAEFFARVLDHFLGPLWEKLFVLYANSWLTDRRRILHAILYADDLLLIATPVQEASDKLADLHAQLASIGLQLSVAKCKCMLSPPVEFAPTQLDGQELQRIERVVSLGFLLGFNMHVRETLAPRLSKALNTLYGFYKILSAVACSPKKRVDFVNSLVISKWRGMAAAVRPTTAILKELNAIVTTMLMGIFRFPQGMCCCLHHWTGLQGEEHVE